MNSANQVKSIIVSALNFSELVFHSTVRDVRTQSGNATFGVFKEVANLKYKIGCNIKGPALLRLLTGHLNQLEIALKLTL